MTEFAIPASRRGATGVDWRSLLISGSTAAAAGVVLWNVWWWAGHEPGAFRAGLKGHGPDPYAWPRLLALWAPAAHVLFALAYALLARWDPRGALRRHVLADQVSLVLVLPLLAALPIVGVDGDWRAMLGIWFTLFIGVKTAILVGGLWRWLTSHAVPAPRASVGIFLGAFLPYLFLGAHVVTAMSSTSDEPYYLLVSHSLLHDGDMDLANNFATRDYLPFYWGELPRDPRAIRLGADGQMFARLYQGLQPVLLLPGYAAAGRAGAVITMNLFGAAALLFTFRLALASGASLRAAFLAWLGAAFSLPFVTYGASPFPEISGAFFATAAAYLLWHSRLTRAAAVTASLCLVAMVAAKTRLFLLAPPIVLGFPRRVSWKSLALAAGALGVTAAVATAYDAFFLSGYVVWQSRGGGVLRCARLVPELDASGSSRVSGTSRAALRSGVRPARDGAGVRARARRDRRRGRRAAVAPPAAHGGAFRLHLVLPRGCRARRNRLARPLPVVWRLQPAGPVPRGQSAAPRGSRGTGARPSPRTAGLGHHRGTLCDHPRLHGRHVGLAGVALPGRHRPDRAPARRLPPHRPGSGALPPDLHHARCRVGVAGAGVARPDPARGVCAGPRTRAGRAGRHLPRGRRSGAARRDRSAGDGVGSPDRTLSRRPGNREEWSRVLGDC